MKLSKPLLWLITLVWFTLAIIWYNYTYCNVCNNNLSCNKKPVINEFIIVDSTATFVASSNFKFNKSSYAPIFNVELNETLDSFISYQKRYNNNKPFTITGYYKVDEKNETEYKNLGLARADSLKKWFAQKGLNANDISIEGFLSDKLGYMNNSDTILGGIELKYKLLNVANTNSSIDSSDITSLFEPRTIYFKSGNDNINLSEDLKKYIKNTAIYLKQNPEKKIQVFGFADNQGSESANLKLSIKRANYIKNLLANNSINNALIIAEGKGIENPIANNNTIEGRAKNRRVTIQIK